MHSPTPELVCDLGEVCTLSRVAMRPPTSLSGKYLYYDIYISENGSDWTRIWQGTTNTTAYTFVDAQMKNARYVKIRTNGNSSNSTCAIADVIFKAAM